VDPSPQEIEKEKLTGAAAGRTFPEAVLILMSEDWALGCTNVGVFGSGCFGAGDVARPSLA